MDDPTIETRFKNGVLELYDAESKLIYTIKPGVREKKLPPGPYKVQVTDAKGLKVDREVFTIEKGGRVVVHVTLAPPVIAKKKEPDAAPTSTADHRAAKWLLSIGQRLNISHNGVKALKEWAQVPEGPFHVVSITLAPAGKVTSADLKNLEGLTELTDLTISQLSGETDLAFLKDSRKLTHLDLRSTVVNDAGMARLQNLTELDSLAMDYGISDANLVHLKNLKKLKHLHFLSTDVRGPGLVHLKDLTELTDLDLDSTKVNDAGLAHLKGLKKLKQLKLTRTLVSDAGLAHVAAMMELQSLFLSGTKITGPGLAHLRGLSKLSKLEVGYTGIGENDLDLANLKPLTQLSDLIVAHTQVSDAGVAHLKDLPLSSLDLGGTRVTDVCLVHLQNIRGLRFLLLGETRITDAGLGHLLDFPNLTSLYLDNARVSAKGAKDLQAALPKVSVTCWEPNHTAARRILTAGGNVHMRIKGEADERILKPGDSLPQTYFQITRANLSGLTKGLGDAWGAMLRLTDPDFDDLRIVDLSGIDINGQNIRELANLPELEEINLARVKLSDADLTPLIKLKKLRKLILESPMIQGTDRSLKALSTLEDLTLACPTITDLTAQNLALLTSLKRLSLRKSGISHNALPHLFGLKDLMVLDLSGCGITDEGLPHLKKMTHLQYLSLAGTKLSAPAIAELRVALSATKIDVGEK